MSSLWLLCILVALADPASERVAQRAVVEGAAAAVATARAQHARRAEIAVLMRTYREAATRLEQMEQVDLPADGLRRQRLQAISALTSATLGGRSDPEAHELLSSWLGDPEQRIDLLQRALQSSAEAKPGVRRGLLLDIIEQADALSVLLTFDAGAAEMRGEELELRVASLRRRGPGQAASMGSEVDAVRLEREVQQLDAYEAGVRARRRRVLQLRAAAAETLEGR